MFHHLILAVGAVFLLAGCTSPPVRPAPGAMDAETRAYLHEHVEFKRRDEDVAGFSVVLADRQGTLWTEGFGWASAEKQVPMTPEQPMMVGSVTKLFTAIAILQLAEQGRLDLDAPLTTVLPDLRLNNRFSTAEPTIRQMLSHRSGLPSDLAAGWMFEEAAQRPADWDRRFTALPGLLGDENLVCAPGTCWSYSNLAYSLLGLVIERVSGTSYPDYLRQQVLEPLGMHHSALLPDDPALGLPLYGVEEDREIGGVYIRDLAAGGLATTAQDMGRFLAMLLNEGRGVLSPASFRAMLTLQTGPFPAGEPRMGLGFLLDDHGPLSGAGRVAGHDGAIPPYHAALQFLPDAGFGVVVMTNQDSGASAVHDLAREILTVTWEARFGPLPPPPSVPPVRTADSQDLANLSGYYMSPVGLFRIEADGAQLRVDSDLMTLDLRPHEANVFTLEARLLGFFPVLQDELGRICLQRQALWPGSARPWFSLQMEGQAFGLAVPVEPMPADPRWQPWFGTYAGNDTSALIRSLTLSHDAERGFHLLALEGGDGPLGELPVAPLDDDTLIVLGHGRHLGETLRRNAAGELVYSGLHFRPQPAWSLWQWLGLGNAGEDR